jgi:hypothetical protein
VIDHDLVEESANPCDADRPIARFSARTPRPADGRRLADSSGMAVILLVLFPFLLMVDTRLAWLAMAVAIGLICQKKFSAPSRPAARSFNDDASI